MAKTIQCEISNSTMSSYCVSE